jgi:hypothetical protein
MLLWTLAAVAAEPLPPCALPAADDPVAVYLVTVTPGFELITALGHTFVMVAGGGREQPVSYNYGAFDRNQDGIAWKLARGQISYTLAALPWSDVAYVLLEQGRPTTAQRLDLRPDELARFLDGLEQAPERQGYPYDWETANCSTKARDALDAALGGAWSTAWDRPVPETPRDEIRRHLGPSVPRDLAWSFVAGPVVDQPMTAWDRAMFPDRLQSEVQATRRPDGAPYVAETCQLGRGIFGPPPAERAPTVTWAVPGVAAAWFGLGASFTGRGRRADVVVGLCAVSFGGLLTALGTVSLLLWAITTMKGAGPTLAWGLAGPQSAALVVGGAQRLRGQAAGPRLRAVLAAQALSALVVAPFVADGLALALLPGVLALTAALWRAPR